MSNPCNLKVVEDRVTTRILIVDLDSAGYVYSPKMRPANRRRQSIVRFLGRDDSIERFSVRYTVPYPGHDAFSPPTQAQNGATQEFYEECCETAFQANTMLSARDYALAVCGDYRFNRERKRLLTFATAAYLLSEKDLRALARSWHMAHRGIHPARSTGSYRRCYQKAERFASKLKDDMMGAGAQVFG